MKCPFCGEELKMEAYRDMGKISCVMFCDNDDCEVKPCTAVGSPSNVVKEAECFGRWNFSNENREL